MKIINNNGEFTLQYKYKLITNRVKKTENTYYYYYTTQFSAELLDYFGTNEFWIYKHENNIYLTTEEPTGFECKKLTARNKYNSKIRSIPLNNKIFNLVGDITDKYVVFDVHLNEKDMITDDIKICISIV